MRHLILLICATVFSILSYAQNNTENINGKSRDFVFKKYRTVDIRSAEEGWDFNLSTVEKYREGNEKYGQGFENLKKEVSQRFPRRNAHGSARANLSFDADTPVVLRNFRGNGFNYGVPNDNSMAISDSGILVSVINSNVYMYDVDADSLLKKMSLNVLSDTLDTISSHQYDPRVVYDPVGDRFITVHLAGASSDTLTNIIVGFSQSADPTGLWNMYKIPGDPMPNDTNWTDFPAVALTKDELIITGNLLHYGGSWQTSFDESVIWQIDKSSGYNGNALDARLWHDVGYGGKSIRNLHPIQGGNQLLGPNFYLMSNRNFAVQNDTFFLLEVTNTIQDTTAQLNVQALTADFNYGAPPHALQPAGEELQTNDARVLGGFLQNNMIQFVGNTVDTVNGHATIYHGLVNDVANSPSIHGNIINDTLDYGYPNISYTGKNPNSEHAMLSFNHTNANTHPGSSAMFYEGNDRYSKRITLKKGSSTIDLLTDADRWGDYTGSQPRYNHPGRVWVTTSYGVLKKIGYFHRKIQTTWVSELSSQYDDSTTTVPEIQNRMKANAYPNPVPENEIVFVELETNQMQWASMKVYDMQGRKIKTLMKGYLEPGKHQVTFNTQQLNPGMYLFVIRAEGKQITTKKIVVE